MENRFNYKIVADSSADLPALAEVNYAQVPLLIRAGQNEYLDDETLDVHAMVEDLRQYKGRSTTACPGIGDWLTAFDGADAVFAVSITSALSGGYNAAVAAGETYCQEHPGACVHVLDSRSTGPEMRLLVEKLREYVLAAEPPERIWQKIQRYARHTHLLFSLESLTNLAGNGRVHPAVAAAVGILGIRIVGCASEKGELHPLAKCRGESKALAELLRQMERMGYRGGKVRIDHCENEPAALLIRHALLKQGYHDVEIHRCRGLCSYYAEKGGILIGFEDGGV